MFLLMLAFARYAHAAELNQVDCLAKTVYFEAGNQSTKGKTAVAYVTMNRVFSNGWPSTVCAVVYQHGQYGWTTLNKTIQKNYAWYVSRRIALLVYKEYNVLKDPTHGATYYCRLTEHLKLNRVKKRTVIGGHVFYKV
jgi:N-acetylmuramoyl-L-alanine amidase